MNERESLIKGLRDLADFIESHPDFETPSTWLNDTFPVAVLEPNQAARLAKMMIPFRQIDNGGLFLSLVKDFGPLKLSVNILKDLVCRKVKVVKQVETEEWVCDESILDPKENP
jgi:hypothetical protein